MCGYAADRVFFCFFHGRFRATVPICPECGHGKYVIEQTPVEVPIRRIEPTREPVCSTLPGVVAGPTRRFWAPRLFFMRIMIRASFITAAFGNGLCPFHH